MKNFILTSFCLFFFTISYGQTKENNIDKIKKTITNFFKWDKLGEPDTSMKKYVIVKETISGNMKKRSIDKGGIELYLDHYRRTGFFSESYLNNMRQYFYEIGKGLDSSPEIEVDAIVKIDGLDLDIPLQSFEPELILNYYKKGLFKRISIVSNKAIVQFYISNYSTKMLFTLTKENGTWLIDYIGYYNQ